MDFLPRAILVYLQHLDRGIIPLPKRGAEEQRSRCRAKLCVTRSAKIRPLFS